MDWFISIAETTKAPGARQKPGREWPSILNFLPAMSSFQRLLVWSTDGIWEMWHLCVGLISAINTANIWLCLWILRKENFSFLLPYGEQAVLTLPPLAPRAFAPFLINPAVTSSGWNGNCIEAGLWNTSHCSLLTASLHQTSWDVLYGCVFYPVRAFSNVHTQADISLYRDTEIIYALCIRNDILIQTL